MSEDYFSLKYDRQRTRAGEVTNLAQAYMAGTWGDRKHFTTLLGTFIESLWLDMQHS